MLLAVVVPPLNSEDVPRRFRHPTNSTKRIEDLVVELEDAYRDCYLDQSKRG